MDEHSDVPEPRDAAINLGELGEVTGDREVQRLAEQVRSGGLTRSGFFRRTAAMGIGGGIAATILTACGGGTGHATASTTATTSTSTLPTSGGSIASKYKNKKIGVVHLTAADENEYSLVKALQEASDKAGLNWTYLQSDSQGDQGKAQQGVEAYISQRVDGIILLVVSSRLVSKQIADATNAKIPVFGMWTFSELDPNIVVDYTSVPAADASALAGYMFDSLYLKKPSGTINVALVDTNLDILQARSVTVRAIAKLYPRVTIVDSADIDLTDVVGSATNITNGFLSKHSNLDAIWTNYPPTGPAAAAAIQAANKTKQVGVFTHVAESAGLKALADPNNPLQAMPWLDFDWESYHLTEYMLDHFAGNPVDRLASYQVIVPFQVFTKSTVRTGATGTGSAVGHGWTLLDGIWKGPLIDSWKQKFAS